MNKKTIIISTTMILISCLCIILALLKIFSKNEQEVLPEAESYNIVDESLDCDESNNKEEIFRDENYVYYLLCEKSDKVFLVYNTNKKISLKEAINMISIDELINNGLEVTKAALIDLENYQNEDSTENPLNEDNSNSENSNSNSSNNNSSTNNSSNSNTNSNNNNSSAKEEVPPKPTCQPKLFEVNGFRADFDNFADCDSMGSKYSNYQYSCRNATDQCGITYFMLRLYDENGTLYYYKNITP